MFHIIQRRYWFFLLSTLLLLPGVLAVVALGVPRSIDFTGGTVYQVRFDDPDGASESDIRAAYSAAGVDDVQVVEAGSGDDTSYQMRSRFISADEKAAIADALEAELGPFEELLLDARGPSVGEQVSRSAAIAVAAVCIGILIYLTIQFRTVPHPVRYGITAIVAMLHDVLLVVGLAAFMGWWFGWEVDALFITALLTIIGFSVHDSIVVFDRIRENVGRMRGLRYEDVVNHSVIQTLDRSINTQLTAIFTLFAIFLYTQGAIRQFVFWLIVGFVAGTYSSIFTAAPLLVVWENREWRRWLRRDSVQPVGS